MSETVTPRTVIAQLVETMRALAGSHPGFRPVHAKGIVCTGTFHGTREARGISRALHLQGLESRVRNGPVAFILLLQLAAESDPTDDVTALWPADRSLVDLGRLEVTAISPTSAADERRLVFDPTNLTDGINLSADPILLVRSTAYSLSYDERSQGA